MTEWAIWDAALLRWGAPLLAAACLWWASTGLIFLLDRVWPPAQTLAAATLALAFALAGALGLREHDGVGAAYAGFICGLGVWAWHEVAFLTGFLSGPRQGRCPPGLRGWARFRAASETILHHELALAATLGLLALALWSSDNQMALWTFALLWVMRLSAKLNLFFGAPNISLELLPERLSHLPSYFGRGPVGLMFAASVGLGGLGTAALLAAAAQAEGGTQTGLLLLAGLLALAVLEHWFMASPLPDAALWRWMLPPKAARGRGRRGGAAAEAEGADPPARERLMAAPAR
ncbi:MAG: putative photosynthetic complex assembly protein PuhE [Pseudomonadota bacterium]